MNIESNETTQKKNKGGIYAIIGIIIIALVALGVWGIVAYLTATDSAENVFTVGNVSIRLLEPNWNENNATDLVANQEMAKDPKIQNNGSNDAYVFLKVTMPKAVIRRNGTVKQELFTVSYNGQDGINSTDWDLLSEAEAQDGDSVVRVYYYKQNNGILAKNTTSNALFDTIKLANITDGANLEGRTINVQVDAYAIQSNSIDLPSSATTTKLKATYAWEKYWAQDEELKKVQAANLSTTEYGKYVDLGTNLLGQGTDKDWRIFYKDDQGRIYLILADYLPNSNSISSNVGLTTSGTYNVYEPYGDGLHRQAFLDKLNDGASWKTQIFGATPDAKYANVTVKGAIDLETWTKAWNERYGGTEADRLYIDNTLSAKGYNIKRGSAATSSDYGVDLSDTTEYTESSNTLFWPHKAEEQGCYGYWLASPSAKGTYSVMIVFCNGAVGNGVYNFTNYGVRPAVYLPSYILLEEVDGVYSVVE